MRPPLHLSVPNELVALEAARQHTLDYLSGDDLPASLIYRLELVLEETLMNRLWHAYPQGERACTQVTVARTDAGVELCVEDEGVHFDPLQAPLPQLPPPADVPPGGFGLLLTRKAASRCHYERRNGRNRFTVQFAAAAPQATWA